MKHLSKYMLLFLMLLSSVFGNAQCDIKNDLAEALFADSDLITYFSENPNATKAYELLYELNKGNSTQILELDFVANKLANQTPTQLKTIINTAGGYDSWKNLANAGSDLLTSLKTTLNNVPTNLINKLDNWSIDELTRLESHLNKYSDLAGELSNPKLFEAVETIVKNPENAWDALRDLKSADIVSESVNRIGKSSFFTDVIGKGKAFEKSVLLDIVQGFTSKSGTAYNAVKNKMAT